MVTTKLSNYILKNKILFVFSCLLFLEIICIFSLLISHNQTYQSFLNIKADSNINPALSSVNWSFWDLFWNSGKSMNTYGSVSRFLGSKDEEIIKIIKNLFLNTTSTTSKTKASPELINYFYNFNLNLQFSFALVWIITSLTIVNILLLGHISWNYFLTCKKFNLYKLILSILLNVWGFLVAYAWEQRMIETGNVLLLHENIGWLIHSDFFKNTLNRLGILNTNSEEYMNRENLLFRTNKLFFSPDTARLSLFRRKKSKINWILNDINLKIKKGTFNIIIGPNGSGKTTLVKTLINLNENYKGEIFWNEKNIQTVSRSELAKEISYIPQGLNIENSISIIDFLKFARYPYRKSSYSYILNNSKGKSLDEIEEDLINTAMENNDCKQFAGRMINELSEGQRQKVFLTSVLIQESKTIVLDEPTAFLDIKNQHQFLEILKRFHMNGKTIIMVLHDIQQSINYADNLIVMKDGKVRACGHPSKIINSKLMKEIFKINCRINTNRWGGEIELDNIQAVN